jgi:plasmid stabilization system protein ParE
MVSYDLTPEAEEDLKDIIRYTIEQWGLEQAQRYADLLEIGCQKIADETVISRTFSQKYPDVFVAKCEHHFIFYLRRSPRPLIIAFLHERMDLVNRLKNRLE